MIPPFIHELKIDPVHFVAVESGAKPFEIRKYDRPFKRGDTLVLLEFDRELNQFTGRHVIREITYLFSDPQYVKTGYVVLGIK